MRQGVEGAARKAIMSGGFGSFNDSQVWLRCVCSPIICQASLNRVFSQRWDRPGGKGGAGWGRQSSGNNWDHNQRAQGNPRDRGGGYEVLLFVFEIIISLVV